MRLGRVDKNVYQILSDPAKGNSEIVGLAVRLKPGTRQWVACDPGNARLSDEVFKAPAAVLKWFDGKMPLTLRLIQQVVAENYGLSMADLKSERRAQGIARPRQIAIYLSTVLIPHLSLPAIGKAFDRDHTTVMHAKKVIEKMILTDDEFAAEVNVIQARLGTNYTPQPKTAEEIALQMAAASAAAVKIALIELAERDPIGFIRQISAVANIQPHPALRIVHSQG